MKYVFLLAILFCGFAHAAAPRCNPGDYSPTVNWEVGVAAEQSIVSILWCNDSTGLEWWAAGWNPVEAPINSCAGNLRSESATTLMAAFWANCLSGNGSLTAAQQTTVNRLLLLWMPKLETPVEHNVYEYANGELLDRPREGRVPAHTVCQKTVVASLKGVDYYDVSGQYFVDGAVIPPHSAAVCTLAPPPATGWPQ
jgi:hypothetical protein